MKHITILSIIAICMGMSSVGWSYDTNMAKSYAELFAPVVGAKAGKALHLVKPDGFIKDIREGKDLVVIDVRTPAETSVYTMSLRNSLAIPVDQLFHQENLVRIPTDKPVVILCKSGVRATVAGTALRHIGFNNVFILKGGFQALNTYYGPKQAYASAKK